MARMKGAGSARGLLLAFLLASAASGAEPVKTRISNLNISR
jgi:hypothetical protein